MELDRSLLSWGSQPEPDSWSTGGSPHSVYCAVCPSAVCKSKPTGPLPGWVSQARGPPRACVWSSESELRAGGRQAGGGRPACLRVAVPQASWSRRCSVAGGHARPLHPRHGPEPVAPESWPAWGGQWVCPNCGARREPLNAQSSGPVLPGHFPYLFRPGQGTRPHSRSCIPAAGQGPVPAPPASRPGAWAAGTTTDLVDRRKADAQTGRQGRICSRAPRAPSARRPLYVRQAESQDCD